MSNPASVPVAPPLDNAAHLRRSLELLELRLRRQMLIARAERGGAGHYDEFAGMVVSDEEIDRYLETDAVAASAVPGVEALTQRIAAEERALALDVERTLALGQLPRLELVRAAFELSPPDYGALVACLAPELELRFERLFAYLQNDVAKRRPCVQLLGRLFPDAADGALPVRRLTATEDSLVGLRLVEPVREAGGGLAARELKVADGVVAFLLESDRPDPALAGRGRFRSSRAVPATGRYFDAHRSSIERLVAFGNADGRLPYVYVRGAAGSGKEELVLGLAASLSARVFETSGEELGSFPGDTADWLRVLERNLRLHGAFWWIRRAEALLAGGDAAREKARVLGAFLHERPGVNVVFTGERGAPELWELAGIAPCEIALAAPEPSERLEAWATALGGKLVAERPELAASLASKFKFGPSGIASALERLRWEPRALTPEDVERAIHRACRAESTPTLDAHAQKLRANYRWSDLVLPEGVLEQLREIRNAVRFRARVHGEWGFGSKFSLGRGLAVLFSGPSGTGKTMSAEVLATDLELDIYKIDLSQVVSKYIGETEKNLARIFTQAENANGILLFDEADALFGKRSEVKDSHDRYANIEINYLLQRLEEFEGIVILTTNMLKNLDPAFTRRIQYTVEFPVPDEQQREFLWTKVFPPGTPRSEDLDLGFVAKRFKLSGASIKNVALNSAFLAASNGGSVNMGHLLTALQREYRKMGKLASKSDFGAYYHLVREDREGSES